MLNSVESFIHSTILVGCHLESHTEREVAYEEALNVVKKGGVIRSYMEVNLFNGFNLRNVMELAVNTLERD